MAITVNGVEITDAMIAAETENHGYAPNPREAAIQQLILHQLLLQQARAKGLAQEEENLAIASLLDQELQFTPLDEAACLAFYEGNSHHFQQGESAVASHILFARQNGDELADSLQKAKAEGILAEAQTNPARFADLAREHSACPSGKEGGSLGQFGRGQMVPPFEEAVFSTDAGEIAPYLVETQFGWHIVQVNDRQTGGLVPFEAVKEELRQHLNEAAGRQAMHQYLSGLVQTATIEGYQMPA